MRSKSFFLDANFKIHTLTKRGITMRYLITSLSALGLLVASSAAHAIVLYDESVSGDLATFDTITLDLTAGTNSVLGSSLFTLNDYDFDGFQLSLGSGLNLLSVDYYINNLAVSTNTVSLGTTFSLRDGGHSGTTLDTTSIDLLGVSPQEMFAGALPLPGLMSLSTSPNQLSRGGDGGSWNYEIRFTVASATVPEPSVALLIASGLIVFGITRRKVRT